VTQPEKFPLLAKCYEAGDVLALFPLLMDWEDANLSQLLTECDEAARMVDERYGELATSAPYFFSKHRSDSLDKARFDLTMQLSEIASVALHYLGEIEVKP
jgi:hypothetical protein